MMLECVKHAGNSFVTLTYDEKNLPPGASLDPVHTQKWLKRLRKALSPESIRYFLVGEYGDETKRPHYHAAIFGMEPISGGGSDGLSGVVRDTWSYGHTFTGQLNEKSAGYICGYVTKKMTSKEDPRLKGRYPEFARMSLRPGVGAVAMKDVAESLDQYSIPLMEANADVPSVLAVGKKKLPLGRYLTSILRREMGYSRKKSETAKWELSKKMCLLHEEDVANAALQKKNIGEYKIDKQRQQILNLEKKFKIHNQRGTL